MTTTKSKQMSKKEKQAATILGALILAGAVGVLTLGNVIYFGWEIYTDVAIENRIESHIRYAADSPPDVAVRELQAARDDMSKVAEVTNTCVFLYSPNCNPKEYIQTRIDSSIEEAKGATTNLDITNFNLSMHRKFIKETKDSSSVNLPYNLNVALRYGNHITLGWWLDFIANCTIIPMLFFSFVSIIYLLEKLVKLAD